jgi:hypothetical protein
VLVLDEFARVGVRVRFLHQAPQQTPEDELLLQVQGVSAAYERAKMVERVRRGRRQAARLGSRSALAHAPYGYRSMGRMEGVDPPRDEVVLDEARVVRQVFRVGRTGSPVHECGGPAADHAGRAHAPGESALGSWPRRGHAPPSRLQGRSGLRAHAQRPVAAPHPASGAWQEGASAPPRHGGPRAIGRLDHPRRPAHRGRSALRSGAGAVARAPAAPAGGPAWGTLSAPRLAGLRELWRRHPWVDRFLPHEG